MDSFESLVSTLLEREGYWARTSFKVELSKEEKRDIGRPSSPRWELDIVAYKGVTNEILVVECKSFLDSPGVRFKGFDGSDPNEAKRYKIFNDAQLRQTVLSRLSEQLQKSGACAPSPSFTLALAAGKIASKDDRDQLRHHFKARGWKLFDEGWLCNKLSTLAGSDYENEVSAVVAKLIMRNRNLVERLN